MSRSTDDEDDRTSSSSSSVIRFGDDMRENIEKFCPYSDCRDYRRPYDPIGYKAHIYQYHTQSYYFRFSDQQDQKVSVRIERSNGTLTCNYCFQKYRSFNSIRWHLFKPGKECSDRFFKDAGGKPREMKKTSGRARRSKEPITPEDTDSQPDVVKATRMNPQIATHRYGCNICFKKYKTRESLRAHILRTDTDCSADTLDTDCFQEMPPVELLDISLPAKTRKSRRAALMTNFGLQRTYEQAVSNACQAHFYSSAEKSKDLWIVDKIELKPFSLFYRDSESNMVEYNGLTHVSNIEMLDGLTLECRSIQPIDENKKKAGMGCADKKKYSLKYILHNSPYPNIFSERKYCELEKETITLLNKDWTFEPHIKYSNSQLLAGAVLVNVKNGQAVYVNTVETYGTTNTVDSHCGTPIQSPNMFKSVYENLWVSSQTVSKNTQICIATHSCKALITSAFRVDKEESFKISDSLFVFDFQPEDIRIYIDNESLSKARDIKTDFAAMSIETFNLIGQLRDVKKQFDHKSTYFLCRASSYLGRPHFCRPITVFTLCDCDVQYPSIKSKPLALAISYLFQQIAYYTIKEGSEAKLSKDLVLNIISQYHVRNKAKVLFNTLIDLFGDNAEIDILGNEQLNKDVLTKMALMIESDIIGANKSVVDNIQKRLKSL
ncbi:hypothetical protein BY458DRAFT_587818 [Sporodiniella umbellata]|nr:hypothetical protein BY458DRAFT_587818 [Sporodiniella umbellata]